MGTTPSDVGADRLSAGHLPTRGATVGVPSQRVSLGSLITVHPRKVQPLMLLQYRTDLFFTPSYLSVDYANLQIRLMRAPHRDEIPCDVDERLVAQYYTLM